MWTIVVNLCLFLCFRKEKKQRKAQRLDAVLAEDADAEDALDVTSLEEERDRIIYLVQERRAIIIQTRVVENFRSEQIFHTGQNQMRKRGLLDCVIYTARRQIFTYLLSFRVAKSHCLFLHCIELDSDCCPVQECDR